MSGNPSKSFMRSAAASPLAGILRGGMAEMLSRGASNISDAGESADLRRPPAPRSPEAWTPLRGEDNAGACRSTGSGPSEGAAVDSPRGTDLRGVVSPGARHSRSARNSTSSKAPVSFGGLSAGGGLGGMMMGARRTSASELSMNHLSLVGSEAADADAIVTYGGGPPEPKPPHTPGILSLGLTTGIRFHGSQADAAPGDRGAAGAWDDPFVASRSIDQLLDALAMTGIARLDVLQRLTDNRDCSAEETALLDLLVAPATPPVLAAQEARQITVTALGRPNGGESAPSLGQLQAAAEVWAHVRPLPASATERLVLLLRQQQQNPVGPQQQNLVGPAADAVCAALLATVLLGRTAALTFGGWAATHLLLRLLSEAGAAGGGGFGAAGGGFLARGGGGEGGAVQAGRADSTGRAASGGLTTGWLVLPLEAAAARVQLRPLPPPLQVGAAARMLVAKVHEKPADADPKKQLQDGDVILALDGELLTEAAQTAVMLASRDGLARLAKPKGQGRAAGSSMREIIVLRAFPVLHPLFGSAAPLPLPAPAAGRLPPSGTTSPRGNSSMASEPRGGGSLDSAFDSPDADRRTVPAAPPAAAPRPPAGSPGAPRARGLPFSPSAERLQARRCAIDQTSQAAMQVREGIHRIQAQADGATPTPTQHLLNAAQQEAVEAAAAVLRAEARVELESALFSQRELLEAEHRRQLAVVRAAQSELLDPATQVAALQRLISDPRTETPHATGGIRALQSAALAAKAEEQTALARELTSLVQLLCGGRGGGGGEGGGGAAGWPTGAGCRPRGVSARGRRVGARETDLWGGGGHGPCGCEEDGDGGGRASSAGWGGAPGGWGDESGSPEGSYASSASPERGARVGQSGVPVGADGYAAEGATAAGRPVLVVRSGKVLINYFAEDDAAAAAHAASGWRRTERTAQAGARHARRAAVEAEAAAAGGEVAGGRGRASESRELGGGGGAVPIQRVDLGPGRHVLDGRGGLTIARAGSTDSRGQAGTTAGSPPASCGTGAWGDHLSRDGMGCGDGGSGSARSAVDEKMSASSPLDALTRDVPPAPPTPARTTPLPFSRIVKPDSAHWPGTADRPWTADRPGTADSSNSLATRALRGTPAGDLTSAPAPRPDSDAPHYGWNVRSEACGPAASLGQQSELSVLVDAEEWVPAQTERWVASPPQLGAAAALAAQGGGSPEPPPLMSPRREAPRLPSPLVRASSAARMAEAAVSPLLLASAPRCAAGAPTAAHRLLCSPYDAPGNPMCRAPAAGMLYAGCDSRPSPEHGCCAGAGAGSSQMRGGACRGCAERDHAWMAAAAVRSTAEGVAPLPEWEGWVALRAQLSGDVRPAQPDQSWPAVCPWRGAGGGGWGHCAARGATCADDGVRCGAGGLQCGGLQCGGMPHEAVLPSLGLPPRLDSACAGPIMVSEIATGRGLPPDHAAGSASRPDSQQRTWSPANARAYAETVGSRVAVQSEGERARREFALARMRHEADGVQVRLEALRRRAVRM